MNPPHPSRRPRERVVTTADGVPIRMIEAGRATAPAVVLVHGFASDADSFQAQLSDPVLLEDHRLIAFDLRGHGLSNGPSAAASLTGTDRPLQLWASDLAAVIDGLADPLIVGWSFGAAVVQQALIGDPALLDARTLLVAAPCAKGVSDPEDPASRLVGDEARTALTSRTDETDDGEKFAQAIFKGFDAVDDIVYDNARTRARLSPVATARKALPVAFDFRAALADRAPSQRPRVLLGERDSIFSCAVAGEVWGQAGCETTPIVAAGHAIPQAAPDALRDAILALG